MTYSFLLITLLYIAFVHGLVKFDQRENLIEKELPTAPSCVCENTKLCSPLTRSASAEFEVYGFYTGGKDFDPSLLQWKKLSTVAASESSISDGLEILCLAHDSNTRLVTFVGPPTSVINNPASWAKFVEDRLNFVQKYHLDGINLDYEDAVPGQNITLRNNLSRFTAYLYSAFKKANENYQISYDVAWSPNCIDLRCYDFLSLSKSTDFLFVMAYDERSQLWNNETCIAGANCDINQTAEGLVQFQQLGIPPNKLILGLPWYGYHYPCANSKSAENIREPFRCALKPKPFRGAPCSDAAGSEWSYASIMSFIDNNELIQPSPQLDNSSQSLYLTYQDKQNKYYQFWFDNQQTLAKKYQMAMQYKLRGVGIWSLDQLNYTMDARKETQAMWTVLPPVRL